MKIINIREEYGLFDLDNKIKLNEVLQKINIANSNEITLNLTSVLLEYPGTSTLVDKILDMQTNLNGKKKLIINTNILQSKETLLNTIFWGSHFFNIETYNDLATNLMEDSIKDILYKKT